MPAEHMTPLPTLADLLQGYADVPDIAVEGIATDSRRLGKGYLFLACAGLRRHGLDYLEQALDAGIAAVAWDASTGTAPVQCAVPAIGIEGLAGKLGEIANRFYGRPSEHLEVVGVTGTNGKTTVAWLIAQCGALLGERCAYLGTLGHGIDELQGTDGMTTPPVVELQGRLAEFVDQGARYAALEVSSHALAQHRVDGVRFDAALFTNLTRDHLDYHSDMNEYFESKARLFLDCSPRHRIVNLDSDYGALLAARCGQDVVTVSTRFDRVANGRPFVFVRSVVATDKGSDISFVSSWGDGRFSLQLPGDFNVANAAIVLALLLVKGVAPEKACEVLSAVTAPPGRMQRVAEPGPAVYVDYAHTPHALEVTLRALRAHCRGKLWCVFGCGGDRDAGKRPQMGAVAERLSDRVVVTSDNPRHESPGAIIDAVMQGMTHGDRAIVIEDRAAAIAWAIASAGREDAVLIAGKGHEDYQQVGDERRPFSDYGVAVVALAAKEGQR